MGVNMKKFLLLVTILLFTTINLFGMPGFKSYIDDTPGEFVYYKDNSFKRESYIGILMYDQSTFQIKYYAPADSKKGLKETNIAIAVTIDPSSPYWNMTGEKIITPITETEENLNILNYLHDFLYEMSSRRIKLSQDVSPESTDYKYVAKFALSGIKSKQTFDQFGGKVEIVYDPLIPFFNVKTISNSSKENVLECITFGIIKSGDDKTFDNFTGINPKQIKKNSLNVNKKAETKPISNQLYKLSLDSNWTIDQENGFFMLGESAFLNITGLKFDNSQKYNSTKYSFFTARKTLYSTDNQYTDITNLNWECENKFAKIKFSYSTYVPSDKDNFKTIKVISNNQEYTGLVSFATFMNCYNSNKEYFEKVINSVIFF